MIGDATVNGTAGAITSGFETLTPPFPVPVPPRVYNSRNITIITEAPEVEPGPSPSLEFAISSTSEEEGSSEDGEEPAAEAETVTEEEVTEAEITTAEEQVTATTETQPITATSEIIISEQITTTTETTTTETTTLETTTETTISEQITAAETAAEAEVVAEAETVAEAEAVVAAMRLRRRVSLLRVMILALMIAVLMRKWIRFFRVAGVWWVRYGRWSNSEIRNMRSIWGYRRLWNVRMWRFLSLEMC